MNINELIKTIENSKEYKECSSEPLPVKDRDIKLVNAFMLMLEKNHITRNEYIEKLEKTLIRAMGWAKVVNGTVCINVRLGKNSEKHDYLYLDSFSAASNEIRLSSSVYIPTIEKGFNPKTVNEAIIRKVKNLIEAGPTLEAIGILEYLLEELPNLISKE